MINGVVVPVEVSEEELRKVSVMPDEMADQYRAEGNRGLKEVFIEYLVSKMDVTDEQYEDLEDSCEWEEFINTFLNLEDKDIKNKRKIVLPIPWV